MIRISLDIKDYYKLIDSFQRSENALRAPLKNTSSVNVSIKLKKNFNSVKYSLSGRDLYITSKKKEVI
jgi:hypothetical protein